MEEVNGKNEKEENVSGSNDQKSETSKISAKEINDVTVQAINLSGVDGLHGLPDSNTGVDQLEQKEQSKDSKMTPSATEITNTENANTKKQDANTKKQDANTNIQDATTNTQDANTNTQDANTNTQDANTITQDANTNADADSNSNTNTNTNTNSSNSLSKLWADLNLKPNPKYSLKHARTIHDHTLCDDELTSSDQIPKYIFNKLMIVDYNVREFKIISLTSNNNDTSNNYDSDDSEDEDEVGVNPMDALLGIFHCSDNFLRRYLAVKLSECQLSVPFLLPDPRAPSENVTILLSALENITKSWSFGLDDNKSVQHVFATEHSFPVVSFVRINQTTMSKSSLINRIMNGKNRGHEFFFHKDMKGGNVERKVVDGLVELSWYLPRANAEEILQDEICFANLRGDAKLFNIQLKVLWKVSSVLCVILPSECLDESVRVLSDIWEKETHDETKVIVILGEKAPKDAKEYFKDLKSKHGKMFSLITKTKKTNDHDFVQIIRKDIQQNIKSKTAKPLVEFAPCASEYGIQLDDHQSDTPFAKGVDSWLKMPIQDAKDLLRLQKHVPDLASLEREIHLPTRQGNKSVEEYRNEIRTKIWEHEIDQKESSRLLDERIYNCFTSFAMMKEPQRNQALNKLKCQLDKMSLHVITELHHKYHTISLDLQKKRDRESEGMNTEAPEANLIESLKRIDKSISKRSFGLEHIIREFAQLYQIEEIKYDYAGAAADMLLSGQPLEILDGDSFYIPLKWFKAVYTKVEHKTKNANIFVISVVGIQSSGKSTMLNTMFGLEFPVSAGRCTRGVFASLLPVSKTLMHTSKFDYVLVIDTEGLRGSADPQLREHDNELATFAIGVADLTIVNIFGENHNTMKDFLEIAVHAFLKMKLVEETKKKACKIVHQNVAATNATERLVANRFNLRQGLDEMTKLAAIQEKYDHKYSKFNDIISFNENEDVFYLPTLLKGNPPIAPVNPEYGKAVQKVKEDVIKLMCSKGSSCHSVSQFRARVINLWKAILKENFIFSLRNTIEVRARMSLDRKYFEKSVGIMVAGMAELEQEIVVALKRCSTRGHRVEVWSNSEIKIRKKANDLRDEMANEMNVFFETDEDKTIVEQWKPSTLIKIDKDKEIRSLEVRKNCLSIFDHLQAVQDVNDKKLTYEKKLLESAKKFITTVYDNEDEKKLNKVFESQWQRWIKEVPPCQESKIDINLEMVNFFSTEAIVLPEDMRGRLTEQDFNISKFRDGNKEIYDDDLAYDKSWKNKFLKKVPSQYRAKCIRETSIKKALDFAKRTSESGVRFNGNQLKQMVQIVIATIEKETEECSFKFKNSLQCDILLNTFAQAYEIFYEMEERFCQERDIRGQMEKDLRPRLEEYFRNACKKMGKEMLAADSFVYVLRKQIKIVLNSTMGPAVARIISREKEFQNKEQFHARVLIQLGEEGNFKSYIHYLQNLVGFLRSKLTESIENVCLEKNRDLITSVQEHKLEIIGNEVLTAILIANDETDLKSGSKQLDFWIQRFVEKCSSFAMNEEMFSVATIEVLENIDLFKNEVCRKVNDLFMSLKKRVVNRDTFREWNPSPADCLSNTMFFCIFSCPFCETLCDRQTMGNHDRHSSHSHRPLGIIGYKDERTRKLATDDCTKRVAGEKSFKNPDTSWNWRLYKNFQSVDDYYKSWDVSSDSTNKQRMYWQWFMGKFSTDLAKYHKAEEAELPTFWLKDLRFNKVKENLEEEYLL